MCLEVASDNTITIACLRAQPGRLRDRFGHYYDRVPRQLVGSSLHRHGPSQSLEGARCTTRATQLAEAARKYRDNHHWVPLVLKDGKNPGYAGWQKHKLEDADPEDLNDDDNIGILLGKPSGDLVQLD